MHQSRYQATPDKSDESQGLLEGAAHVGTYVAESADAAGKGASRLAGEVSAAAKEHPFAALAIAAGLAFAVGALWKMGTRPQSRFDTLVARLPDVPNGGNLWPRSWR